MVARRAFLAAFISASIWGALDAIKCHTCAGGKLYNAYATFVVIDGSSYKDVADCQLGYKIDCRDLTHCTTEANFNVIANVWIIIKGCDVNSIADNTNATATYECYHTTWNKCVCPTDYCNDRSLQWAQVSLDVESEGPDSRPGSSEALEVCLVQGPA